ncbi:MAG: MBL fold metallo-hydrolase [Mariniblastus sp.]|nr:MBL fold metallo-hydrolase [Mariniblastus sp.]
MLKNAPLKTLKHDGLTIEGYSRAAVQSYWRIPELKMGFDLGAHPWDFMGTPTWFITHCHLDHIAALPLYVARRRLMKMAKPKIYLPAYAIDAVRKMLDSFQRLDRGRMPCDLIGVEGGQELEISRELVVNVLKTKHTLPSVGYVISERRKKLKQKFLDLSGDQIRDLKTSGTEITEERRLPLIGFTGDTSPQGLDDNPLFYQTKILITEMTFIADDHRKELIHKNGHMHLDDFVARQKQFENEIVIAGHFSTRYNMHQARKIVTQRLPSMFDGRLKLWV